MFKNKEREAASEKALADALELLSAMDGFTARFVMWTDDDEYLEFDAEVDYWADYAHYYDDPHHEALPPHKCIELVHNEKSKYAVVRLLFDRDSRNPGGWWVIGDDCKTDVAELECVDAIKLFTPLYAALLPLYKGNEARLFEEFGELTEGIAHSCAEEGD